MNGLERKMLLYMLYTPRTKESVIAYAMRPRLFQRQPHKLAVDHAFDSLEDRYLIEEFGEKELEAFYCDQELTVPCDPPSGFYMATYPGVDVGEEMQSDERRFWLPIIISTLISSVSLVASLLIALN